MALDLRGAGCDKALAMASFALALSASALAHLSLDRVSARLSRLLRNSAGRSDLAEADVTRAIKASILGAG